MVEPRTEEAFSQLCRRLTQSFNGLVEVVFQSRSTSSQIIVTVIVRTVAVTGSYHVLALERLCERALRHLADGKRQLNQLAADYNVILDIKE